MIHRWSNGHKFKNVSCFFNFLISNRELLSALASIKQFAPGVKIIVWDLGFTGNSSIQVSCPGKGYAHLR